jgi:hypothetical protein
MIFPENQLQVTDVKTTTYNANVGEMVMTDTTGGSFAVAAPANPSNGDRFAVRRNTDNQNLLLIAGGSRELEYPFGIEIKDTNVFIVGFGAYAEYMYNATDDFWMIVSVYNVGRLLEYWQGTNITTIPATPQNIVFTFVPLYTSQPQVLLSHSSGVFTVEAPVQLSYELNFLITFNSFANNTEAETKVAFTTNANILDVPYFDSFQSGRAGTFKSSGLTTGAIKGVYQDTFSIQANEEFSTSMGVDITNINFFVAV